MTATPPADAGSASAFGAQARAEAERTGKPVLLYYDADQSEQLFLFAAYTAEATVGRVAPADLLIEWDEQVSRAHARFELVGEDWEIVDDGMSSNGTFVNEERVQERRRLRDGDMVRFGTTVVAFCSPARVSTPTSDAVLAEGTVASMPAAGQVEAPADGSVALSSTQRRVLVALCGPARDGLAAPAGDEQIAEELFLSLGEVRTHVRVLYAKLGVEQLAPEEMRVRLVELAFSTGLINERDL